MSVTAVTILRSSLLDLPFSQKLIAKSLALVTQLITAVAEADFHTTSGLERPYTPGTHPLATLLVPTNS